MTDRSAAKITAISGIAVAVIGLASAVIVALVNKGGDEHPTDPLRVAGVSLTAPVQSFGTRCPITLTFNGSIDVAGGTGDIVYRWLHSDGFGAGTTAGSRLQVAADGPGSVVVTDEWTPNVPLGEVARTTTLEILEPKNLRSDPVLISGQCDYRYPAGPSIPPPQVPGGPPG